MKPYLVALMLVALAGIVHAQTAQAPRTAAAVSVSDDAKKDIARHRGIAAAHEAAAKCLEAGKAEAACHKDLQAACKGLAIGKYCGMRHEH